MRGDYPFEDKDHRKANNPYEAKFGDDWEIHLRKSCALSPYVPITDVIQFMCEESQRLMVGTYHEHDWYFYHDALSYMTAKEAKESMKTNHYA